LHVVWADILAAVRHANDPDSIGQRDMEDHVIAGAEAPQADAQFSAFAASQWISTSISKISPMRTICLSAARTLPNAMKSQIESRSRSACGALRNLFATFARGQSLPSPRLDVVHPLFGIDLFHRPAVKALLDFLP
jgi:hypothetical protein